MRVIGQAGFRAVQALTGNPLLDSLMVLSAEYAAFLVPASLIYMWTSGGDGREDSLFTGTAVFIGTVSTYLLGLFFFHQPPHLQGFETLLQNDPVNAFPSQHAAFTFSAVWPVLYKGRKKLSYIMLGAAALTGFARVYTGLHFPIDILGGILSSLIGFGAVYLFEDYLERNFDRAIYSLNKLER